MHWPEYTDRCHCGHQRYEHLTQSPRACTLCDSETCVEFNLKMTFRIALETWLEFPKADRAALSRRLYGDLVVLLSPQFLFPVHGEVTVWGKTLTIDDTLADNELAFMTGNEGFSEKVVLI